MNKLCLVLFCIFLISCVCADCGNGQIDINSASGSELEKLDGVGEKIAEYIIDARPFENVNDLIDVYRIGEVTLEKIKDQGLACVGDENDWIEKSEDVEEESKIITDVSETEEFEVVEEPETITLNSKIVKEERGETNIAIYGFVGFCVLLCFLLVLNRKRMREELE